MLINTLIDLRIRHYRFELTIFIYEYLNILKDELFAGKQNIFIIFTKLFYL